MRVWLLLSGEMAKAEWQIQAEDFVIAVDGGMRHAQTLNVLPNLWIGDFDSASQELQHQYTNVPRETFSRDKNFTDFELALDYVQNHFPKSMISIVGVDGKEDDHVFGNLWVLPQCQNTLVLWRQFSVVIASVQTTIHFSAPIGSKVSLFAVKESAMLTSSGLQWDLKEVKAQPFRANMARNITTDDCVRISWKTGYVFTFLPAALTSLELFP